LPTPPRKFLSAVHATASLPCLPHPVPVSQSERCLSPPPAEHPDAYTPDRGFGDISQEDWGIVILIFIGDIDDSCQLLLIVPLPRRRRRLTRSGVILGCYEDGYIS
jgi:hypothetical protein